MDNESGGPTIDEDTFYAVSLDESWNVMIYTNKWKQTFETFKFNLRSSITNAKEIKGRDLFGMGYPYHIKFYGEKYLAISSDYGVLFFTIEGF